MGVLNTTPRTWVAAEIVTAAELNAEVRDPITAIQSAWTAYTPTLTNITLGSGTMTAYYRQNGKTIHVRVRIAATASGTPTSFSAGTLGISAPVPPHTDYTSGAGQDWAVGSGVIQPAARQGATVVFATSPSTGVFNFIVDNLASSTVVTNLIPGTFGTSSALTLSATYEAA